jgi:hypothetical protein
MWGDDRICQWDNKQLPTLIYIYNMHNAMFILAGNCRTFLDCIDNIFSHVILRLFHNTDTNIFIYFYLKLNNPAPKGQPTRNYAYADNDYNTILNKINQLKESHPLINMEYNLLLKDEISDKHILSQVKTRKAYTGFYSHDHRFVRGVQCHYNFEKCGKYILEKEDMIGYKFDYLIYIRPDLFFTSECDSISKYNNNTVTLGEGLNEYCNDHIALIPRQFLNAFFFDRMQLYRTNKTYIFTCAEDVYHYTILYEVKSMGKYDIKRQYIL